MIRQKILAAFYVVAILSIHLASDATGQSIASALLREGEPLPGDALGSSISGISNTAAARHSGFAFTVSTMDAAETTFSNIWGNLNGGPGTVLISEGVIGNQEITSLEGFFGLDDSGRVCYGTTANDLDTMETGLDGVYRDSMLLLNEDEPVPTLPGSFSTFNSRPGITADGQPYWIGGVTDVVGGGTADRVLFLGIDALPVLRGGDPVLGLQDTVEPGSLDFDSRFSACGSNYITIVDVTSGDDVVVVNGAALEADGAVVRAGTLIPASVGGIGDSYDNFDFLNVTESGSYLVTGDTDASVALDEFVMIDGEIVLREGDIVGPGLISGAIESAFMNEERDWAAIWSANIAAANVEVLIFNGEIILTEGQTVDWNGDGVIDGDDQNAVIVNFTGISPMTITRVAASGMLNIYFTADCDVDGETLEGGFVVQVPGNGVLLGDLNGDGIVTLLDIAPFVKAISSGVYNPAGDINGDNQVDLLDISGLIQFIQGN